MEGRNNMGLLQNERLPSSSSSSSSLEVFDSLWVSNSSPLPPPPPFHGSRIVNFSEATQEENTRKRGKSLYFPNLDKEEEEEENGNENYDDSSFHHHHQPEKKRRLSANQVHFLEKSFEVENKLEPERKAQLAKELGLQPRQVAIWFQNRRARYKTKLLEKDYDSLKSTYDQLNSDYDSLFKDNDNLKIELQLLTEKLLKTEKGKNKSEICDFSPGKLLLSPKKVAGNSVIKQEDAASSAKSDSFDSPPHCCTDGNNHSSSFIEPDHSSNVFEPELSDFSQDEDDHNKLSKSLLQFPKLEYECYDHELQPSSCNLGFSIEDQSTWFWAY